MKKKIIFSICILLTILIPIGAIKYKQYSFEKAKEKDLEERFKNVSVTVDDFIDVMEDAYSMEGSCFTESVILKYVEWVLGVKDLTYKTEYNDLNYKIKIDGYVNDQPYSGEFIYIDKDNGDYEEISQVINGIENIK